MSNAFVLALDPLSRSTHRLQAAAVRALLISGFTLAACNSVGTIRAPCGNGAIIHQCTCGKTTATEGFCCSGAPQETSCNPNACEHGAVTGECACGEDLVSTGYCCSATVQVFPCDTLECGDGLIGTACSCGGTPVWSGYCCGGTVQATPCDLGACENGSVTASCSCGGTAVSEAYCCSGVAQASPCAPDACREGQITAACSCGGTLASTGYCCHGETQSSPCGPLGLRLDGGLASGTKTYGGKVFYPLLPYLSSGTAFDSTQGVTDAIAIENTAFDELYQTETWVKTSPATFTIYPLRNGDYTVHLHFVDWMPNAREFSVRLQGEQMIDDLDIKKEVGSNAALVRSFDVTVTNGALALTLNKITFVPEIAAIEILPRGADHLAVNQCGDVDDFCPAECTPERDAECVFPACAHGAVTETCMCGGVVARSGYCCTGVALTAECANYYVSPNGNDAASGDAAHPFKSFEHAHSVASPGDLIYFRAGTYHPQNPSRSSTTLSGRNGEPGNLIRFFGYPGETVIFDFGTITNNTEAIRALIFTGNYWHWKNIEITGTPQFAGQHMSIAFRAVDANHNRFEQMRFRDNHSQGMTIAGNSDDNWVVNCDSYRNQDPIPDPDTGKAYGNANGFTSVTADGTTNHYVGCRAWWNSDDGWDHFTAYDINNQKRGTVVHEDCWSFWNGYLPGTFDAAGDGQGFKFGASFDPVGAVIRYATGCIAFENRAMGFDQNGLNDEIQLENCTAYHNGSYGIRLGHFPETLDHIVRNCISYDNGAPTSPGGTVTPLTPGSIDEYNSWNIAGVAVDGTDFLSLSSVGVNGPRGPDGSLPVLDFLRLAPGSDLIDKGTDVGRPFLGAAPDLGAFERE